MSTNVLAAQNSFTLWERSWKFKGDGWNRSDKTLPSHVCFSLLIKKETWQRAHVWGCLSQVSKIRRCVLGHWGVDFLILLIAGEQKHEEGALCLFNKWCSWNTTIRDLQEGNHKVQCVIESLKIEKYWVHNERCSSPQERWSGGWNTSPVNAGWELGLFILEERSIQGDLRAPSSA